MTALRRAIQSAYGWNKLNEDALTGVAPGKNASNPQTEPEENDDHPEILKPAKTIKPTKPISNVA